MRSFQRPEILEPVPGDVVAMLGRIDRSAGAEARYADQLPQLLESLRQQARVESITASSAIEGVTVDASRVPNLAGAAAVRVRNRNEAEFAGYRAALDYLNQDKPGDLTMGLVLHLHRLLFSYCDAGGGALKLDDNLVVDKHDDGTRTLRFEPVSARETPFFMEELVTRTRTAIEDGAHHPLIVVAAFALDFLCIHPFGDGNGRVDRLLTTYLLHRSGYGVGRYVSIEQLVFDTKDAYYDSLAASTLRWFDDGRHDIWPWAALLPGPARRGVRTLRRARRGGNGWRDEAGPGPRLRAPPRGSVVHDRRHPASGARCERSDDPARPRRVEERGRDRCRRHRARHGVEASIGVRRWGRLGRTGGSRGRTTRGRPRTAGRSRRGRRAPPLRLAAASSSGVASTRMTPCGTWSSCTCGSAARTSAPSTSSSRAMLCDGDSRASPVFFLYASPSSRMRWPCTGKPPLVERRPPAAARRSRACGR